MVPVLEFLELRSSPLYVRFLVLRYPRCFFSVLVAFVGPSRASGPYCPPGLVAIGLVGLASDFPHGSRSFGRGGDDSRGVGRGCDRCHSLRLCTHCSPDNDTATVVGISVAVLLLIRLSLTSTSISWLHSLSSVTTTLA